MEPRALWWLLLGLVLVSTGSAGEYVGLSASQCQVPAKERVDCGYPQVTKEQCNNRGCCFDSSIRNVPWCFKPLQETAPQGVTVHVNMAQNRELTTGGWAAAGPQRQQHVV
ncbi:trefoil factor 3 [Dipodomys spectabilis]|uniref:trefoil factor 3 n=1 Tax=Dipodomys spectabilis TaxID=105255 RepID=UPI001C539474|nr:trefoil factor 3 [Dipodomys spectabilis]